MVVTKIILRFRANNKVDFVNENNSKSEEHIKKQTSGDFNLKHVKMFIARSRGKQYPDRNLVVLWRQWDATQRHVVSQES